MPTQRSHSDPNGDLKATTATQILIIPFSVLTVPGLEHRACFCFCIWGVRPLAFQSATGLPGASEQCVALNRDFIDFPQDSTVGRPDPSEQVCGRRGREANIRIICPQSYILFSFCFNWMVWTNWSGSEFIVPLLFYFFNVA